MIVIILILSIWPVFHHRALCLLIKNLFFFAFLPIFIALFMTELKEGMHSIKKMAPSLYAASHVYCFNFVLILVRSSS